MSAANYLKNKWIDMIINGLISAVVVAVGVWLTASDTNARDLKRQIDEKPSKEYVDQQDESVKRELTIKVESTKKELSIQNEWIIRTLDKMDKRTERIEDKLDKK